MVGKHVIGTVNDENFVVNVVKQDGFLSFITGEGRNGRETTVKLDDITEVLFGGQ